jgi:hypothetical protein
MTNVYEKINVELPEEKTIKLPQISDDLTRIKGIGSGTAEKLNVRKIYTYRQLAEITPEKLSEAPGIGIATARKFIEEAKKLLEGIQKDNIVKLPEPPKEDPVSEELKPETYEIVETEVEEDFERKEVIQQRSITPYEQLLARSDDKIENSILELEGIGTETEDDNIEPFEVAEVIVEEELPQEEFQREEKPIETVQKQWFSDKFNYSRLSATHPPHPPNIERTSKESKVEIEEIEEYQEDIPEQFENNATVEPFENEVPLPKEEVPREEYVVTPTYTEFPEVTKIPEISEDTNIPEISEVSTSSRILNRREDLTSEIAESLKILGYYAIPNGIETLRPFFQSIDYIGLKLVSVNNNSKLIILVPIKLCDLEGRILIDEEKIDFKTYSKAQESELVHTAHHYIDDLLKAKDVMFEDVVNGDNFLSFIQKYLQVRFTTEKSARNKKLYFVSGKTQYKVLIEPILLTKIPAKCMEKSILFPYQRKTNLHVIDWPNIATLLRFLEKKYQLIESRFKRTNSIETYQNADTKFRSSLRVVSLPFIGYAVVLLVIYFSRLYFLLRLFNSIGFAVMGVYFFTIAYFYFKFYKTKKELTTEFETPYYLQNAQFNEIDLLCVKEEFTGEQMAQFGYECFGKDNNFKVLEQIEKDTINKSVVAKQQEQVTPQLYELDSEPDSSSTTEKVKNEVKYSSFFDD